MEFLRVLFHGVVCVSSITLSQCGRREEKRRDPMVSVSRPKLTGCPRRTTLILSILILLSAHITRRKEAMGPTKKTKVPR